MRVPQDRLLGRYLDVHHQAVHRSSPAGSNDLEADREPTYDRYVRGRRRWAVSALGAVALTGVTLSHGSARASAKQQLADLDVAADGGNEITYVGKPVVLKVTIENFGPDSAQGVTGEYTPYGIWASSVRPPRGGT